MGKDGGKKVVAIVQARMMSSRLPGKVMMEINERPMLDYQVERIRRANTIDSLVIATTKKREDDVIVDYCRNSGIEVFRGEEEDVQNRYFECAKKYNACTIVRLTSDCPLIDKEIIDKLVNIYHASDYDFVSNTAPPEGSTYPDGMDVEVFSFDLLEQAEKLAVKPSEREHVTHYFWKNPEIYSIHRYDLAENLSSYRLTVDYPEDVIVIESIVSALYNDNPLFSMYEIIDYLDRHQNIREKNSKHKRNEGWITSYNKDRDAGHI